jgi:predicted DNA-binding transcriptional regulator YafY
VSETAAARLRRILLLIPRLADGQEHNVTELARQVGSDRETLVRDIETLFTRADDPGGFVPGVQVYYTGEKVSLVSTRFLRPMRLTSSELGALELGLAMLRAERPPDERKAINTALERLRKVMVTMPSDAVAAGQREAALPWPGDPATLSVVKRGLGERRKLRIRYRSGSKTEASERTVRPYALVVASGHWYLLAHCESKGEVVSFRLDRMEGVEPLAEAYDIPTTFSVDEHLNDRKVLRVGESRRMRVRYSPRIARWIAEREGTEPDADGSLTMEHPLLDVQWGVRYVLQYGPDAEVVEPSEVREELETRVAGLLAAHDWCRRST